MPKSIFYTHSSGLVEPPAGGFDDWSSRGLVPWVSTPVDTDFTFERFMRFVELSEASLPVIAEKGARFGPQGKEFVLGRLSALYDSYLTDSDDKPTAGDSAA